jgi:hypothetical protein
VQHLWILLFSQQGSSLFIFHQIQYKTLARDINMEFPCKRRWIELPQSSSVEDKEARPVFEFKVMSYNTLAQNGLRREHFPYASGVKFTYLDCIKS